MTACVHTKKVAAVVTASLVGALSLGAAPVAAMADTADTGIDLQAAAWYTDAKVTKATDGKGGTVSNPNEATFILGSGKYLVPTEVANSMVMTPIDDTFAVVCDNDSNWASSAASTARTDSDGNPYYVGLGVGGWYKADGVDAFEITSTSQTLTAEQAEAYFGGKLVDLNNTPVEVDPSPNFRVIISKDGHSVDQVFKIKAVSSSQEIKLDGAVVYDGENLIGCDIVFVDESGTAISPVQWFEADGTSTTSIVNAGSYYAKFSNGQTASFEVQALDLSSASVVINDLQSGKGSHAGAYWNDDILDALVINGDRINATLKGQLDIVKRSNPSAYASGENTVTIARGAGLSSNIKGTASVTFTIYDVNAVDSVEYGRQTAVETTSGGYAYDTVEIWLENGMAYDESKISVKDSLGNTYTGDDLEISYSNRATGEKVNISALAEMGKYSVNVRVKPFNDFVSGDYYGGSVSFDVDVNAMSLNSNKNLAFFFDGKLSGDSASATYDGTDQLSKLETVVKNAAGDTMEEGTDYTLEITKDGKDVESATDAGTYVVTAKPVTFDFGGSAKNSSPSRSTRSTPSASSPLPTT
ncbi:hypothetical protein [Collinsella ihumii]|uniref:MBG domain-containing protein n=1 Tax=Collinsella ihumii TaxID=1720204 RepID=A0AAW7JRN0_9ACTN|nr:hypothetical protein [Collinsella ihumii]MDN0070024.1 hypothetical protein [Collinsella ihumii]